MKIDEMISLCRAINPNDGAPVRRVYLTIPLKKLPTGYTVTLFGRSGPRGSVCNVKEVCGGNYSCTAIFSAPAVLAYIKKNFGGV